MTEDYINENFKFKEKIEDGRFSEIHKIVTKSGETLVVKRIGIGALTVRKMRNQEFNTNHC